MPRSPTLDYHIGARPVEQFLTQAKEKCEELRQWVEEQISQPVDRWVSKQEERCKRQPWWSPLRWLCSLVTVVVKVVVWVVVTVGKWVVTIVCQVVTIVVGIVVTLVLGVLSWLVAFFVCLFTDPLTALKSLLDLWGILLGTIGAILDFIGVLLDDLIGILNDFEHLLDSLISTLGWPGVLLGLINGLVQLARDLVSIVRDIVGAVKDIVLGILSLNLCRVLRGLGDLLAGVGRVLLNTGFAPIGLAGGPAVAGTLLVVRVAGYLAAGVRDAVNRLRLEEIIRETLAQAFSEDPERIERALEAIGINGSPMGLPFTSDARRLFLSSQAPVPDLRRLHGDGVVNIYAHGGYPSTCRRTFNEADGEVVYAGTDLTVFFTDLQAYLSDSPGSAPEFHVFPISRAKLRRHLEVAQRKAEALGIRLLFPTLGTLQATSPEHVPLNAGDFTPPGDAVQQDLFRRWGRTGTGDDLSIIPTISHFHYVLSPAGREPFGLASWFRPSSRDARVSGVTYRNLAPDWVFRWVLAHELGHYWGLNHANSSGGDRSFDEIMFAPASGDLRSGSSFYEFLLGGGEPRFTLDDARTTWRWITTDGAGSLLP